jgi:YVTN family beta-propeller protein
MLRYPVSGPCNRAFTADNRAVRPMAVLLVVCCCLSAVSAQQLEKVIYLPDSLSGLAGPTCLALNRANRTLYVAGEGTNVIAISESTGEKVARLDVGSWVNAICCNSAANKIYVALWSDTVVVIDGTDNTIRARLPAGNEPVALLYDSVVSKVYCANSRSDDVTVIDALLDSVVATTTVGDDPAAFCHDPTGTKVYCALSGDGEVAVLDAQADSLLLTIDVGREPCALLCNSQRNEIYCANRGDRSVSVISVPDDSVLSTVTTARYPRALAYDPTRDRLYVACENREVTVVDCAADTVLAHVSVDYKPWDVLYNGTSDRVYCANYSDQLVVIDAAADTIVKTLTVAARPCALALNADRNDVYCVSAIGNALTVIDASQDTVAATVTTGCNMDFAVFSEKSDKLYVGCRFGTGGHLAVIDGTSNVVQCFIDVSGYGWNMCYDSSLDKVYVGGGGDSILTAIDCARDSVVAAVVVPGDYGGRTCCNPVDNKVYSTTGQGGTLTIVDAAADSVITTMQFPPPDGPRGMCYNPANNLLYVHTEWSGPGSVFAIDGRGDSIAGEIHTNLYCGGPMLINPLTNILYDADELNSDVALIDCKTNQLLGGLYAPGQPTALCCDTRDNRVFVATMHGFHVWVFDGLPPYSMDSVPIDNFMNDIFYNPLSNRVYCAAGNIYVIDGIAKVVLDSFQALSYNGWPAFALNPVTNRVYALDNGSSRVMVFADTTFVGLRDAHVEPRGRVPVPRTVVRDLLYLPEAGGRKPQAASLLDISGRKVLDLSPGANDVRALPPGVYFIKEQSVVSRQQTGTASVTKVVLAR